jgi:hypothetical protein
MLGGSLCASRTRTLNRLDCGLAHGTRAAPQTARLVTRNLLGCGLPTGSVADSQPARLTTRRRDG